MAPNTNRKEKHEARQIQVHLDCAYTRALRLLREGQYKVVDGKVVQVRDE